MWEHWGIGHYNLGNVNETKSVPSTVMAARDPWKLGMWGNDHTTVWENKVNET
jgi:hypothetical protein